MKERTLSLVFSRFCFLALAFLSISLIMLCCTTTCWNAMSKLRSKRILESNLGHRNVENLNFYNRACLWSLNSDNDNLEYSLVFLCSTLYFILIQIVELCLEFNGFFGDIGGSIFYLPSMLPSYSNSSRWSLISSSTSIISHSYFVTLT